MHRRAGGWRGHAFGALLGALCRAPPPTVAYVLMPDNVTLSASRAGGDLSKLGRYVSRWSFPADSASLEGLGGGIAWAMQPDFCDNLIRRFPEQTSVFYLGWLSWVSCADIVDAVQRGMQTWSDNSKVVSFTDLTGTAACSAPSGSVLDDPCPWEMLIKTTDGSEHEELAAYVIPYRASHFFNASGGEYYGTWYPAWQHVPVRSPAGVSTTGADPFRRSELYFNTHICWYLDATFCYEFQRWANSGVDVQTLVQCTLLAIFGAAAARLLWVCSRAAGILFAPALSASMRADAAAAEEQRARGEDPVPPAEQEEAAAPKQRARSVHGDPLSYGRLNTRRTLDYLATVSPMGNVLTLFFLVFPPTFFWHIYQPCHECYDFEAAMAHELGHVLGFGHPDAGAQSQNLEAPREACIDAATCTDPFGACAELRYYDQEASDPSVMQSLTRRSPTTCLSASDLAGLHALYPVCDGQIAAAVSCVKTARHSGWLRLASVVLPPFLLSVVLVLLPLHFLRRREARRMRQLLESHARLNESHARLSERYSSLRASVARAVARPFSASAPSTASPTRQPSRASVAASSAHGAKPRGGGRRVHPASVGGSDGGPGGPPQLLVVEEEPGGVTEATAGGRRGEGRRRRDRPRSIEVSDAATTAAATAPSF